MKCVQHTFVKSCNFGFMNANNNNYNLNEDQVFLLIGEIILALMILRLFLM